MLHDNCISTFIAYALMLWIDTLFVHIFVITANISLNLSVFIVYVIVLWYTVWRPPRQARKPQTCYTVMAQNGLVRVLTSSYLTVYLVCIHNLTACTCSDHLSNGLLFFQRCSLITVTSCTYVSASYDDDTLVRKYTTPVARGGGGFEGFGRPPLEN